MEPIPPLAFAAYAGTQVQRQEEEKIQQVRHEQARAKDASPADRFEHSVESSEEVQPIHDETTKQHPRKNKQHHPSSQQNGEEEEDEPRLDLTA